MKKISSIVTFLNNHYEISLAEEWDNVGVQVGEIKKEAGPIVVALDFTVEVMDLAIKNKAKMIVVHHPFNFSGDMKEEIKNSPVKSKLLNRLENTGIVLYVAHTNYDKSSKGMKKAIAKEYELEISGTLQSKIGLITKFKDPIRIEDFIVKFKKKLNQESFRTIVDLPKTKLVSNVAILPGAGDILDILEAHAKKVDLILTSDIKWNDWITIHEMKIPVVEFNHDIEKVFIESVGEAIQKKFKKLEVIKFKHENILKLI
ncbi:MAG: Nif3-like dinuclear metal center hexameric protein [Mycoplasma sp.]|nr:Nif3-like dinuclear metal center hexameric protein [Mycoplasma sp.]